MRHNSRKHARTTRPLIAVVAALAIGAGGVVAVGATAGAWEDRSSSDGDRHDRWKRGTIACPDVGMALEDVPEGVETDVAEGLTALDAQVAGAYETINTGRVDSRRVLDELASQRRQSIRSIVEALRSGRGQPPRGWGFMDKCRMKPIDEEPPPEEEEPPTDGDTGGEDGGAGEEEPPPGDGEGEEPPTGPVAEDFVDITQVEPNVVEPEPQENASTGSFTVDCGRNEEGHFNSDNVIVAPGVSNGAHHVHDYVGNLATDAFSTDEVLAEADTTCENDDRSTHYWPVLRAVDGVTEGQPGHSGPGGGEDGNVGTVLKPASVTLTFTGSPVGEVTAMPTFLRIITGDAKAFTNGTANANASWSCTGFEDTVQLTDKYPLCPEGEEVVRTFDFQSCWDGANTDSGNHRDHVAFAEEDGSCPEGFTAIPQLTQRITYDVPRDGSVPAETPFAVDSFPEQLHKPVTDHGDFINVMPEELMAEAVECINGGEQCQ